MKIKPKLLTLFLLISTIFSVNAQHADTAFYNYRKRIELCLNTNNVPAVGIGLIENGKLKQIMVFGDLKENEPAPYNTIFQVASLTKPVTTMVTLRLVSMGALQLDEPVSQYWIDPDVADDPRHLKLTPRLLLTHQSGFDNWRRQTESKKLVFNFDPGKGTKYSGEGFEYLRRTLEKKFNMPLQQLADSILFKPLHMKDTYYTWNSSIDESRYALAHDKSGKFIDWTLKREKNSEACAADLLKTTIEDYCKFGISVIEGNGLSEEIFEDMIKPLVKGSNWSQGLGWGICEDLSNGEYALYHSGHDDGVHSVVLLLPKSKRGVVVFTNGENGWKMYEELIVGSFDIGEELFNRILTKK
jgi:CubicO group peptidase (beta-lactamase class C family)